MELLVFLHKINLFFSQTSILLSKKQSSDTFGGKSIVKTTNKSQLFMISLPSLTTRLRNSLHSSATGRFITFRHSRLFCVGQFGISSSGAARCSIPTSRSSHQTPPARPPLLAARSIADFRPPARRPRCARMDPPRSPREAWRELRSP